MHPMKSTDFYLSLFSSHITPLKFQGFHWSKVCLRRKYIYYKNWNEIDFNNDCLEYWRPHPVTNHKQQLARIIWNYNMLKMLMFNCINTNTHMISMYKVMPNIPSSRNVCISWVTTINVIKHILFKL